MSDDWEDELLDVPFGTPDRPANHIEARFWVFHATNPQIYELFCEFTRRAISRGYLHFSVSMIIERIRWETNVETYDPTAIGEGTLKINNNYRAYYARLWMRDHPSWPHFFRTRVLTAGPASTRLDPAGLYSS